MKWMPMDTAPKDGTPFLATTVWIIVPNHDKPTVDIIEWDPEMEQWYSDNGGWIDETTMKVKSWMPLPEADLEGEVWD